MTKFVNNLKILYEDNHLLVVEKFENILSQKDRTNDFSMVEIIIEYLRVKYQKPGNVYVGLVHRLDRRVGGVMVFAKTSKAARRLSQEFAKNNVEKRYLVCVENIPLEKNGTLIDYLLKTKRSNFAKIVSQDVTTAQKAILNYRFINSFTQNNQVYCFLAVDLITGRYNQIRAQLSHHGHSLLGDVKYHGQPHPSKRIGLWCYCLKFKHPTKDEWLEIKSHPRGDFWNKLKIEG